MCLVFQASADICVEHNKFVKYLIDVEEVAEDVVKLFLHCEDSEVREGGFNCYRFFHYSLIVG